MILFNRNAVECRLAELQLTELPIKQTSYFSSNDFFNPNFQLLNQPISLSPSIFIIFHQTSIFLLLLLKL